MFDFELYRLHWILLALGLGLILTLLTALTYIAIWRVRGVEREAQLEIKDMKSFLIWVQKTFPWILILTIAGTGLLAIIYPIIKSSSPPNW